MKIDYKNNKFGGAIFILLFLFVIIISIFYDSFASSSSDFMCKARLSTLMKSLQSYVDSTGDNSICVPYKKINIKKLIDTGYLKQDLKCPLNGFYYVDENFNIHCSRHGKLQ